MSQLEIQVQVNREPGFMRPKLRTFKGSPERRAIVAASLRRRKQRLKDAGLCQDCGAEDPARGHTLCVYCLSARRKRQQEVKANVLVNRVDFTIDILPPSVNHYLDHGKGHGKTAESKLFCDTFAIMTRKLKNQFVVAESGRFQVELHYWPGPRGRGDVDNRNKLPLDCCAKAGMFRNRKGELLSDAWVKKLAIEIHDNEDERAIGPEMRIIIEAL